MEAGLKAAVNLTVTERDLATALGSGDVPVLGTPRLIALCEEATVAAIAGQLREGDTSVGSRVECDHTRRSLVGETVIARATLVSVDKRRLQFTVSVTNGAGDDIAAARIWRVVVERDRFLGQ